MTNNKRRELDELGQTVRLLEIRLATLKMKRSSGEIDEEIYRSETETLEKGLATIKKESAKLKEEIKEVSERALSREKVLSILSELPIEKSFHFYTDYGQYTGRYAKSLKELCETVRDVDSRSIRFHIGRRDFQTWIKSINDSELAAQIDTLIGMELSDEELRKKLYYIVKVRIEILKKSLH